jgi:hypothetical protein
MLIYHHLTIDLKAVRDHLNSPDLFPANDRKKLTALYDTFEEGRFHDCAKMIRKWGDAEGEHYPLIECVDENVFDVIHGTAFGDVYSVAPDRKVKARKGRAKN